MSDAVAHLLPGSAEPRTNLRRSWTIVTSVLVLAIFMEAAFAGAMLSGIEWARRAHTLNAIVLMAATLAAAVFSLITLRRVAHGLSLGLTLLALGAAIALQTAAGEMSAKGANLLWVHVPLGVALVAFAGQAAAIARKLGDAEKR